MSQWRYLMNRIFTTALPGTAPHDADAWATTLRLTFENVASLNLPDDVDDAQALRRLFDAANDQARDDDKLFSHLRHREMRSNDIAFHPKSGRYWLCLPAGWQLLPLMRPQAG